MKRITLILCALVLSFATFGQSFMMEPEDVQKLEQQKKNAYEETKDATISMGRAPFSISHAQQGQTQLGFKDGHLGYAWNIYAGTSGILEGPISLNLETGAAISIAEVASAVIWMAAGEVAEETWYAVNYHESNGSLYTVDPANGDYTMVGATGYSMTGLAFDPVSGIMYASGYDGTNSQLYTVDMTTGAATHVGMISAGIIIGIAADGEGNMYGINLDDNLYAINAATGMGTLVGPLGVDINYAQDIAFDRDNDILYGALYTTTGGLYTIDVASGAATLISNFGAEVAGFGIPYTLAEDGAPAAVADLTATVGADGALEVTLEWTNPSTQFDGNPLTELTSVVVERNGVIVQTLASPVIGEAVSFFDDDFTVAGVYSYSVYGVNTVGEGPKTNIGIYVGEDVPAAPGNVVLVAQDNDGFLTWVAPTAGHNGGYYNPASLVEYHITRNPGGATFTVAATETEFLDETVPGIGFYNYTVVAVNNVGDGGAATSNTVLLAAEGAVFMGNGEVTSCEGTFFDSGGPEDEYGNSENFTLTFYPETEGAKMRFQFTAFNTESGYDYLYVYMGEAVDPANLVGQFAGTTVPAPLVNLISTHTTGAITFRFTSDGSVPKPGWQADFSCFTPAPIDLEGVSITGNTTPSEGVESNYTLTFLNRGSQDLLAADYTVELRDAADNVLGTANGMDVLADATVQVVVPWTPAAAGPLAIHGFAVLAGDGNPDNNATPNLNTIVQPGDIVAITIGDGVVLATNPYNFFYHHSLQQTLYYPEEIGLGGGVITGIQYVNNFNADQLDRSITIWMGETEMDDLSGGWVDPASLQLVFQGTVDFPAGVNNIFIPLDDIYVYGGGNLVIYNLKADNVWSGSKTFYNTADAGSNRTRRAQQDNTPYDPTNPPAGSVVSDFPNITMFFSTAGLGALEGNVTDGTDPLEGVLVKVLGTNSSTLTDVDGDYEFPFLLPDTYNVEFSKFGYEATVVEGVTIEEDVITVQNAALTAFTTYTVSGTVTGNDGLDLEGAVVTLEGYDDYMAMTNADGEFAIAGVYEGTYAMTVTAEGYEGYANAALLVDQDVVVDVELDEMIVSPFGLTVEVDGQDAMFSWNEAELMMLFQHDGAIPAEPNAFYQANNKVYGTVFDLTAYPDASVSFIDFHHLQWGLPIGTYQFNVHIVDWSTFTIIETVGPLSTENNDAWEEMVALGGVDVAGLTQVGIMIQPLSGAAADAYPCVSTDATGPQGLSVSAFLDNLAGFTLNNADVGDFFLNLWITTAYAGKELVKAEGLVVNSQPQALLTRRSLSYSATEADLTQHFVQNNAVDKAFVGFNVFLNDMDNPVGENLQGNNHMFTNLPGGNHVAGVQSVYTTGVSEIVTIGFFIDGPVIEYARIQIIHNSADAAIASVDVYIDGELAEEDFDFRTATPFMDVEAGVEFELHFAPAGAGFANAVGPFPVTFTANETYVVVANGIVSATGYDPAEPFALHVFALGQEEAAVATNTDVLVFHGATDAPEVSVYAQGVTNQLFAFEYGEFAGYLPLPTLDYVLEVRDATGANVVAVFDAPLQTLGLDGEALVVVASGFLNPAVNSNGPAFGLWAALAAGGDLVELQNVTSVSDISLKDANISLFPNPSNGMVNLHSANMMHQVKVIDISGRVVFASNVETDQFQINTREFGSGMYFVQVITSEGTFIGKLQVQN